MSLIPLGVTIAEAALLNLVSPVLFRVRSIGDFVADITVREVHRDELVITKLPVEQGAAITDHAYKQPATVSIETGWSNSSTEADGNPNYIQEKYGDIIALQASRQPVDIITGKRVYRNMLLGTLSTFTDEKTENAMMLTIDATEVNLVNTQTVQVPPASAQKMPDQTQPAIDRGAIQTQPAITFNFPAEPPIAPGGGGSGF